MSSSVDRAKLYDSDTLELTLRFSDQTAFDGPDLALLEQSFEILSNNRSSQYRNINGRVESYTEWKITLAPKSTGKLLIPSFEIKGVFSDAIEIEVLKAKQSQQGQTQDIFLETDIDKKQAYVQEQLLFTVRLYTAVSLQGFDPEDLTINDARVEQLAQHQYRRQRQGRAYIVIETVYAVFPQASGELVFPPLTWTVTKAAQARRRFDPFNTGRGEIKRLRTKELRIAVLAKPDTYPNTPWLPAQDLKITQKWSDSPKNFRVGEPITRTITITAKGLTSAQLPPLPEAALDGIKTYPDQPQTVDQKDNSGITGVRVESQAIVPNHSGKLLLPATTLTWWDTKNHQVKEARLAAQEIIVAPAEGPTVELPKTVVNALPSATAPDTNTLHTKQALEQSHVLIWQFTTVLFALLSCLFALLWWRGRQARSGLRTSLGSGNVDSQLASNEKQAFKQLKSACLMGDLLTIREAVLTWAQVYWQSPALTQVSKIADKVDEPKLKSLLQTLDVALYSKEKDATWDANQLPDLIDRLKASHSKNAQATPGLPALYGNIK